MERLTGVLFFPATATLTGAGPGDGEMAAPPAPLCANRVCDDESDPRVDAWRRFGRLKTAPTTAALDAVWLACEQAGYAGEPAWFRDMFRREARLLWGWFAFAIRPD